VHGQPGIQRRAAVLQANAYIPTKAKQAYVGVALKWRTGLCLAVVINTPIAVLAVQADMHTRIGVFLPAHTKARQPADFTIQSLADVTVLTTVVVLQRCRQAQVRWRCVRR